MKRAADNRSGVTLIELILVTLILLVLTGLSAPVFKKTVAGLSARNTAFNISKLMNYAQEMSVIRRIRYKISLDPVAGTYRLLEETTGPKGTTYSKISGRYGRIYAVGQDLKLAAGKREAVFYPDGHCDEISVRISSAQSGFLLRAERFGNMIDIEEVELE